jgi:8-oxo-dGTP diphosphatase
MMTTQQPKEQNIKVAVDTAVFTIQNDHLSVLLVQMKQEPYLDQWAMPGGLIAQTETTEEAAMRMLAEQTGVAGVYSEQLKTFDHPERDALNRVVSIAYIALVPDPNIALSTTAKYSAVQWWDVSALPQLAYDHQRMLNKAIRRLRAKITYSNIAWSLLPESFTLSDLQHVYGVILGKAIDKRNFRKKILSVGMIESTHQKESAASHRPAELYRFVQRKLAYIDIF